MPWMLGQTLNNATKGYKQGHIDALHGEALEAQAVLIEVIKLREKQ